MQYWWCGHECAPSSHRLINVTASCIDSDLCLSVAAGVACRDQREKVSASCYRDFQCSGMRSSVRLTARVHTSQVIERLDLCAYGLQVLLYAQKEEVEPDAIKQLVHLAESALPVKMSPSLFLACCQLPTRRVLRLLRCCSLGM